MPITLASMDHAWSLEQIANLADRQPVTSLYAHDQILDTPERGSHFQERRLLSLHRARRNQHVAALVEARSNSHRLIVPIELICYQWRELVKSRTGGKAGASCVG